MPPALRADALPPAAAGHLDLILNLHATNLGQGAVDIGERNFRLLTAHGIVTPLPLKNVSLPASGTLNMNVAFSIPEGTKQAILQMGRTDQPGTGAIILDLSE